jgi:hypothetical protein
LHQVGEGIGADEAVGDEVDQFEDGCAQLAFDVLVIILANLADGGTTVGGLGAVNISVLVVN